MIAAPIKVRIIHFVLITLIVGFYAIPLTALCLFDCRFYTVKKIASIFLLFFFR